MKKSNIILLLLAVISVISKGQSSNTDSKNQEPPHGNMAPDKIIEVEGVFPHLSVIGDHVGRSETGIGALLPWADRLWMISYVAHIQGSGIGLYEIGEDFKAKKHPESITGTFANRMVHDKSNQGIIGPHFIDIKGNVRTCKPLTTHRLTATFAHLFKPDSLVYFLTMEGLLFETNVYSLDTKLVEDLVKIFYGMDYKALYSKGIYTHFKGGFTLNGRVVVANNSYQEGDYIGKIKGGRLAEWKGQNWNILDSTAYVEVAGKNNAIYGNGMWCVGWDRKSVKMKFFSPYTNEWRTYRLPKGSQAWEHAWNTEWMRIREAQTERYMMDAFGIFYELPVMVYGGNMLGIKPVCNHLRVIPDFTSWKGLLVLGGDQVDNAVGQPQSNLQFTTIDKLWSWGKPSGWGALWWDDKLKADEWSDPYLMNGFDKKVIHFKHEENIAIDFELQVDITGTGSWVTLNTIQAKADSKYAYFTFPDGFSAHWLRVRPKQKVGKCTVQLFYN
ncbi:MAG: hypothetical protein SFY32_04335 [Bacteroidota bacterium]|nr:hypothetical protein [Bacteroidota bacterium]